MSTKRYVVRLSEDERTTLRALVRAPRVAADRRVRAQVLLKVDEGEAGPAWTDEQAAAAYEVHATTVGAIRRRLVDRGVEGAVERQPHAARPRTLNDAAERELLAVAQSSPPTGRVRWTLHLLADRLVQLEVVDTVSHETVRQALKKTTSAPTARWAG